MKRIKITAIVGSFREHSYNRQLAVEAGIALGDRADFELLNYGDVPLFNQDIEYPTPEAVSSVREIVKFSDGIWFFSPEYNHFFPGVLKNLIDWLSRPVNSVEKQVLAGKPAAVSGITPGMSGTGIAQDHLVTLLSFLNMKIMNQPRLTIPNALQQTDPNGRLVLTASATFLEIQAQAFLNFIKNNLDIVTQN